MGHPFSGQLKFHKDDENVHYLRPPTFQYPGYASISLATGNQSIATSKLARYQQHLLVSGEYPCTSYS